MSGRPLAWLAVGFTILAATLYTLGTPTPTRPDRHEALAPAASPRARPPTSPPPGDPDPSTPRAPGPSVHSITELDEHLVELRQSAEARGQVEEEDILAGQRAIEALAEALGPDETRLRMVTFTRDMDRLRRDLPHRPTTRALEDLAARIEEVDDEAEQRSLVAEYQRTYTAHSADRVPARLPTAAGTRHRSLKRSCREPRPHGFRHRRRPSRCGAEAWPSGWHSRR